MPDHRADRAVIEGVVGLGIVERRLHDRRREVERVLHRQVDRVDQLRVHPPLAAVHRLADLGELLLVIDQRAHLLVGVGVVRIDPERGIVLPGVGIADADLHGLDLLLGLVLGRLRHPVERVDPLDEGRLDIADHLLDPRLVRRGEILVGVKLAQRIAQIGVHRRERALVARALLLGAGQLGAVEREVQVIELARQDAGVGIDLVEHQPILPRVQRFGGDQRRKPGDGFGVIGVEGLRTAQLCRLEKAGPVDARGLRSEVGLAPQARGLLPVLAVLARLVRPGDLHLEIIDLLRLGLGVGDTGGGQQILDVLAVSRAQFRHLGIGREVVFPLGHADAALEDVRHDLAALERLGHEHAEQVLCLEVGCVERIDVGANLAAEHGRKLLLVGDRIESGKIGLDRAHAGGVDRLGVEIGRVERLDLAFVRAGIGIGFDDVGHQRTELRVRLLAGDPEGPDAGAVGGDLRGLHPPAVGVFVPVVAGLHAGVHPGLLDSELGAGRRRGGGVCRALLAGDGAKRDSGGAQQKRGDQAGIHRPNLSRPGATRAIKFQAQPHSRAKDAMQRTLVGGLQRSVEGAAGAWV